MSKALQCDSCQKFYKDQDLPHPVGWPQYEYGLVHINAGHGQHPSSRTNVPKDICRACLKAMIEKAEANESEPAAAGTES